MITVTAILVVSLIVIYADYRMTVHNANVVWNGRGSVELVLRAKASLPAQHRVLVPWLSNLTDYYWVRWFAITASLFASWGYYTTCMDQPILGVMMLALYYIWAALFDYSEGYLEVAFFAFFMFWASSVGSNPGMIAMGVLAGLNRETSVFIPVFLILDGYLMAGVLTGVGVGVGIAIPKIMHPNAKRYCTLNMFKTNWGRLTTSFKTSEYYLHNVWVNFVVLFLIIIATLTLLPLTALHYGVAVLFCLLLIPTIWGEIRVFAPVVLFLIPLIGSVL